MQVDTTLKRIFRWLSPGIFRVLGQLQATAAVLFETSLEVAGTIYKDAANGQQMTIEARQVEVDLSQGAVATSLVPAGAMILGVTARVTALITASGGGASWSLGDGSTADLWCTGKAFTKGITINSNVDGKATWTGPKVYAAAVSPTLTVNAGAFTGGKVRITVDFIRFTPPTS